MLIKIVRPLGLFRSYIGRDRLINRGGMAPLTVSQHLLCALLLCSALPLLLVACGPTADATPPPARPVRTATAEKGHVGEQVVLTGHINAENEAALAFRIGGRMIERLADVGDRVEPDRVLAKLDPQDELNALRSAQAALTAAQGQLVEASNNFDRQKQLLERGFTTKVLFDQAQQGLQTAQSRVDDAQAQLQLAKDRVSFTQLRANVVGSITARGAEAGEVVQPGQMIFQVARQDGRDAVFDVPAQVIRSATADPNIVVTLTDDPSVTATGRVRQVDPQADPITRTFRVKVSLIDPPAEMLLGATVTGRMQLETTSGISIPASALTSYNNHPAVWVVDPSTMTVSMRNVEVQRFDPATVIISQGLDGGEIVVSAGIQALYPGRKVRLLGAPS